MVPFDVVTGREMGPFWYPHHWKVKWDHFNILTTGKSDLQCKIKETLLISELKPSLNENVGSEKLFLY